ncbi:MAG TPA: hypothetical protein VHC22_33080 [Pirellulales bacterium]|nr:hypothetical protein [Pirellulales bacterium]
MSRPLQFSLEKLFLLMAWVAILCVAAPLVMRWGGIPSKCWPAIGVATWLAVIKLVPIGFAVARAYRRFRDSEL